MAGFKMVTKKEFPWPVKIKVPSEKHPGCFDVQEIQVQFRAMGKDEVEKLATERGKLKTDDELIAFDNERLRETVVGWKSADITDDEGKEVAYSEEHLEIVLQFPWSRTGFMDAFSAAMSGEPAKGN